MPGDLRSRNFGRATRSQSNLSDLAEHSPKEILDDTKNDYKSQITLYKSTPYTNLNKYINFGSNAARDAFFAPPEQGGKVPFETIYFEEWFNMVSDRLTVKVPFDFSKLDGVNYARWYDKVRGYYFYAQVIQNRYSNDRVTKVEFLPDPLMTYAQGDFTKHINNVSIERQHLSRATYNKNLYKLATNDDVLACSEAQYVHQDFQNFAPDGVDSLSVIFRSSSELDPKKVKTPSTDKVPWGDIDKPLNPTASGTTINTVTSPQGIYVTDYKSFQVFMNDMSSFAYITQNITNFTIVPTKFIDLTATTPIDYTKVTDTKGNLIFKEPAEKMKILKFKDGWKGNLKIDYNIDYKWNELVGAFRNTNVFDLHLMREPYMRIEALNWGDQKTEIDVAKLPLKNPSDLNKDDEGLRWANKSIFGYANKLQIFPINYKTTDNENNIEGLYRGTFLEQSISFDKFDDMPVLIDNGKLSWANSAYDRQAAYQKSPIGMAKTARGDNPNASKTDMLAARMGAINYLGDFASKGVSAAKSGGAAGLAGAGIQQAAQTATQQAEYWRNLEATQKTMQLQSPTVTSMSTGNAFNINAGIYGITLKFLMVPDFDIQRLRLYHGQMGFLWEVYGKLEPYNSMSIMNYFRFDGSYSFPGVPTEMMEVIRSLFASGVECWHGVDNTGNPFTQDLRSNVRS